MGQPEVEAVLSWLAAERQVAVSTHRPPRLPVVLSVAEVARVLALLRDEQRLLAQLLYGTCMRIAEALSLRVKDLDFENRNVLMRCSAATPHTLRHCFATHLLCRPATTYARCRRCWATATSARR